MLLDTDFLISAFFATRLAILGEYTVLTIRPIIFVNFASPTFAFKAHASCITCVVSNQFQSFRWAILFYYFVTTFFAAFLGQLSFLAKCNVEFIQFTFLTLP